MRRNHLLTYEAVMLPMKTVCRTLLFASATLSLAVSAIAAGPHPKFAKDLDTARSTAGKVAVIVQYTATPDAGAEGRLASIGAEVRGRIHQLGIAATVPSSSLDTLESDPRVAHISVDHPIGARFDKPAAKTAATPAVPPAPAPAADPGVGAPIGTF